MLFDRPRARKAAAKEKFHETHRQRTGGFALACGATAAPNAFAFGGHGGGGGGGWHGGGGGGWTAVAAGWHGGGWGGGGWAGGG